jgi:hypothetical protein
MAVERPLVDIIAAVAVILDEAGDSAPHLEGAEHLAGDAGAPRYVWVATGETPNARGVTNNYSPSPRTIGCMLEQIDIHCWGFYGDDGTPTQHRSAAYLMRNNVHAALHRAMPNGFTVLGSSFLRPDQPRWSEHGAVYVLSVAIEVRLPDQILPVVVAMPEGTYERETVVIDAVEAGAEIEFPEGEAVETVVALTP